MRMHIVQVIFGAAIVLFGAWLIGRWAIGVALAVIGLMLLTDGLLRNVPDTPPRIDTNPLEPKTLDDIFERARRSQ